MGFGTCNVCNKEFADEIEQRLHYRTEWHRFNLKRNVAGVPSVTEELFEAREAAARREEKDKADASRMVCACSLCGKEYRSLKAYDQHLKSRAHAAKASQAPSGSSMGGTMIVKPLRERGSANTNLAVLQRAGNEDLEVDAEEDVDLACRSLSDMRVDDDEIDSDSDMDEYEEEVDPLCCFMCDQQHENIETCMDHMHKKHGFFIPDIEYLKDPVGLVTYVGLKVRRDFRCLYCNDRCQPFQSLEAVRMHMDAKGHCKLLYGDGGDDEDADLEDFYDYSSSYIDADGNQLVLSTDDNGNVELGSGGSELILTYKSDSGVLVKTLGSREYMRYYRQKPPPSSSTDALVASLASRYKSMGLATVQSKEHIMRMRVLRKITRTAGNSMRTKALMRGNKIRNLPNNVPY